MKLITVSSFPNREIRVTLCQSPPARPLPSDEEIGDRIPPLPDSPSTCHSLKTLQPSTERHPSDYTREVSKPGYGGLPRYQQFSTYGRRQLLRAGGALEKHAPHDECLFLTLTLPGSTSESMEAMARYSSYSVKSLKSWLSNYISNNLSMYTWEWQKRGALHLHYVVHCPDRERGEWIVKNLKSQWIRILDAIGEASQTDMFRKSKGFTWASNKEIVRVDAQWCKKSVAAYLSKYVSKAAEDNYKMPKNAYCPARWYGVSRPLLALLRSMTFSISLDSLRDRDAWAMYEDCLSLLQSFSLKCYEYEHKVGNGKTVVSYSLASEQESIWNSMMTQICPNHDSSSNTEQNMRRLARNGCILIKKHSTWLNTFMQFNAQSYGVKLLNSTSFKDMSRHDLTYLVDALAYSFRYTQRTRYELSGECKLWYSQMASVLAKLRSEGAEWIGALEL